MDISFLKIWNCTQEIIEKSYKQLITNGYEVKTQSTNTYIKVISCLIGKNNEFLSEFENSLLNNSNFLKNLEIGEKLGLLHDEILIKAIYNSHDKINSLLLEIKQKQKENRIKEEEENKICLL